MNEQPHADIDSATLPRIGDRVRGAVPNGRLGVVVGYQVVVRWDRIEHDCEHSPDQVEAAPVAT